MPVVVHWAPMKMEPFAVWTLNQTEWLVVQAVTHTEKRLEEWLALWVAKQGPKGRAMIPIPRQHAT